MNKKAFPVILFGLTLYFLNPAKSYSQAFTENQVSFTAGYGIGIIDIDFLDNGGGSGAATVGPVYFKAEKAFTRHMTFGFNLAYLHEQWSDGYGDYTALSSFSANMRMNIHLGNDKIFDPYFGFGMGYRIAIARDNTPVNSYSDNSTSGFPLGFEATMGLRCYVSPNLGIYAEAGIAKSVLQLGLVYTLR